MGVMRCPKCRSDMGAAEIDSVEIDFCGSCGLVWFDRGELARIGGPEPVVASTLSKFRCPRCRSRCRNGSEVGAAICPRRCGVWITGAPTVSADSPPWMRWIVSSTAGVAQPNLSRR